MTGFDVVIIGAGVVGSAVARELSRYRVHAAVLERNWTWHAAIPAGIRGCSMPVSPISRVL